MRAVRRSAPLADGVAARRFWRSRAIRLINSSSGSSPLQSSEAWAMGRRLA